MSKKYRPEKPQEGRPSLYKAEYCSALVEHMTTGLSFESFAAICDVSKQTIYDWTEAHPEFLDAKGRGTEKSRLFWESIGRDNIINTSETVTGSGGSSRSLNATVWRLNMANRFGWREKQDSEVPQINVNVSNMSDEDLVKILQEHTKKKDG